MGSGASASAEPPPFSCIKDARDAGKSDDEIDIWMAENLRQELVQDFEERFRSLRGAFLKMDTDQKIHRRRGIKDNVCFLQFTNGSCRYRI